MNGRIYINPDIAHISKIVAKIGENDWHCPCQVKRDISTLCICEDFKRMVEKGEACRCHCNLYCFEPYSTENEEL